MTSEGDDLKTNEFLRRRKLRLQQVREQSKDIAKKIRQRAKVESLRQVVELDAKKQKEYLQRQERLVKQLEEYYAKGIENVGSSHKNASEAQLQDNQGDKVDLSKQRGKEAAAELRRKRQQILDKHKVLLDRKLQAREAANEISREKSSSVANKLLKSASKGIENTESKSSIANADKDGNTKHGGEKDDVTRNDMATQWDLEEMPNEWEPNIPTLSLPKDDNSVKEANNNNVDSRSDKSKRLDLFALSDEMPSSLRGGLTVQEERVPVKSSLTLVSEYLQNRGLRLREADSPRSSKKMEDLQSLKQTIIRTRVSKEGTKNVCHVHDEELIPVPSWHPEQSCGFCPHNVFLHKHYDEHLTTASIMQLNKKFSSLRPRSAHPDLRITNFSPMNPVHSDIPNNRSNSTRAAQPDMNNKKFHSVRPTHPDLLPSPVLRGTSPFRRNKICPRSFSAKGNTERLFKSSTESSTIPRKSSVTMYNHSTRDSRDVPYTDERLVVRDLHDDDDAYSQAMKESISHNIDKDHHKKVQEIRSKVAMTKQNVEKEYKDTISFLNALPKDKGNKPIKTAFMDEQRQQKRNENRQQKLQQEYRKIEKECNKHTCRKNVQRKSRSPTKESDDVFERTDFQYSWMPVPESDGNLAIHTIPTTLKEGKPGNTVKFSKVDSYHEYRSRHKHTPPTKDTTQEKPKRHVEAVVIQNSSDTESVSSDSSTENIRLEKKDVDNIEKLSDAERIIIYKILDSKADKRKKTTKLMKDIAKSLTLIQNQKANDDDTNEQCKRSDPKKTSSNSENIVSFEQLNEGVYKAVNENGENITSMYFNEKEEPRSGKESVDVKHAYPCTCSKHQEHIGTVPQQWESGDKPPCRCPRSKSLCAEECKCGCKSVAPKEKPPAQPSTATSTTSFRTATNDKANNVLPEGGFIKLIDDGGQEAGKFYIGASGFLKDDAYEVVIQLRKKGDEREISSEKPEDNVQKKNEESLNINKVTVVSATQTSLVETHDTSGNKTETVATTSVTDLLPEKKKTEPSQDAVMNTVSEVLTHQNLKQTTLSGDDSPRLTDKGINNERNNVSEKSVSAALLDTGAVPPNRPATSTYTQTSMSSPNHRPVFYHMTSSTSTAYMSPPEMILPRFMKPDYRLTDEDINDPRNYAMEEIELTEQHEYSEEFDCKCRKCMHARKITLSKHVHAPTHRCRKSTSKNARTPPNTARSGRNVDVEEIYFNRENNIHTLSHKKSKCMCRKCESRNCVHDNNTSVSHNSRHFAASKHSSRNLVMRVTSSTASSNKCSQQTSKRSKTNIKPAIKTYVDKLLVLNKDTLKAVQVIDQDCSSVATPGSSIIDVPNNIDQHKNSLDCKLSLQRIRSLLAQKIIDDIERKNHNTENHHISHHNSDVCLKNQCNKHFKHSKLPRKKTGYKVKSLNISKRLTRVKKTSVTKQNQVKPVSSSSSTRGECVKDEVKSIPSRSKVRSKSSPTPRLAPNSDSTDIELANPKRMNHGLSSKFSDSNTKSTHFNERSLEARRVSESSNRATQVSTSLDSDRNLSSLKRDNAEIPMSISTQTSVNVDGEINFMKLAEDKLQNMEKIADLTEKCTQRLSNLARVLEEVRKNKTLVYSQISASDTTSDSDQKSDKNVNKVPAPPPEPSNDINKISESKSPQLPKTDPLKENTSNPTNYIPFLSDIPKPVAFKSLNSDLSINSSLSSSKILNSTSPAYENVDHPNKNRGKPPPALSRIHLKHGQEYVIPHELSTVVEVDSPMSVKLKSSRNDTKLDALETSNNNKGIKKNGRPNPLVESKIGDTNNNPDLLDSNVEISNEQFRMSATESSDNSKIQMIDIRQFNEIMLKPFFSLQEYAKQCNVGALDDGSNLEDIVKDDQINDELSSLHSEASLPDVISELLKRNIISEPFRFDTGSNANSTTVSSESTLSVLALSKARQGKKKSGVMFQNKENVGETSDTLSISSNPDLENAFKKLGMGWASSTLKKTKERLALSSSSNTSSSSLSHFRVKSFNQDVPVLVTDTVSSVLNLSKKQLQRNAADSSKHAEQQTSLTNSMTVKEFLTTELAKKITFNNKSKNDTEDEFLTLFETKMPEEMKHSSLMVREENSIDNSMRSGNNNRARTSTPVQLFKSMTYHSSSSNMSNGLFSKADDLSSVKVTSNSMKHSTSDKDDLIIPNFSLRMKRGSSECSKSD